MKEKRQHNKELESLVKVLTNHYQSLAAAHCDPDLLQKYSTLLRLLKLGSVDSLLDAGRVKTRPEFLPTLSQYQVQNASLDEIGKIVSDENTTRKDLEYIAIERFSVPRGSMRSFSNKEMLIEKLRTLIRNEQTHQTISEVARSSARQTSE